MKYTVLILTLTVFSCDIYSQEVLNFGDTEKTNENPTYESDPTNYSSKRIRHWIVNKPEGTLRGNKCFEDVCAEMGFEFVIQSKDQEGSYNNFQRFLHNLGVKTTLLFQNGPFWRFKLRKMKKECIRQSHDFMG